MDMKKTAKAIALIVVVIAVVRMYGNSTMPAAATVNKYIG